MTVQALARQDTDFNFGHIEPRSMNGSVMKAHPAHKPVRLKEAERFDQGLIGMGIEVIQDQLNALGIRIEHIGQIAYGLGKIGFGPAFGQPHVPLTGQRFDHHEQIARAASPIFVILATGMLRA